MAATLDISEVYGKVTLQGEGPSMGRRCTFVRLARCNLDCGEGPGATWACDSSFTWRFDHRYKDEPGRPAYSFADEVTKRDPVDVAAEVAALGVGLCVVTGGEPLIQRAGLTALCAELHRRGIDVEIETNGTHVPWPELVPLVGRFNCSPKLANSGVRFERRFRREVLAALADTGKAIFKFVAADPDDLGEVQQYVDAVPLPPSTVWVMPAGVTASTVRERLTVLAEPVLDRGWNLSHRIHVELWGEERGR
jgi:organic radical activating enzyme